jgi:hypothetical protein
MQYDTKALHARCIEILSKEKGIYFVEHLLPLIPVSKPTFYKYITVGSNEFNEIKEIISGNVSVRQRLIIGNWADSDEFKKQITFMKVTGTTEIRKALSTSYIETKDNKEIDLTKATDAELFAIIEAEQIKNKLGS